MALLDQLTSIFKLPGAFQKQREAETQATKLRKLVQERIPQPGSITPAPLRAPAPAPSPAPVAPPAKTASPIQIDAINRALGGITEGLGNISKAIPSAVQPPKAPIPEPEPDRLAPIQTEISSALAPTSEERQLRESLSNLLASRDLGLLEAERQPVPLQAILGEQSRIERRAAVQAQTLQDRLAQAQTQRQAALDVAKTKFEFEKERFTRQKPDEEKVDEYVNAENQRVLVFRDKKTGKVRQEVLGGVQSKAPSQTEKDRAITVEVIKRARPLLIAARGKDGYVSPQTYLKLRNDYAEAIGDPKDFDATFAPMLSPGERTRLGVGRVVFPPQNSASAISDLLNSYLGGT